MSKLKPPVFEKPEEPDFIKRLKGTTQAASQAQEKPLSDAPAREDEMPAVEGAIGHDDLDKLREIHGLQKESAVQDRSSDGILSFAARPFTKKEKLAGLGRGQDSASKKRLKHLESLKTGKGTLLENTNREVSTGSSPSSTETSKTYAKRSTSGRKKMKISEVDE